MFYPGSFSLLVTVCFPVDKLEYTCTELIVSIFPIIMANFQLSGNYEGIKK